MKRYWHCVMVLACSMAYPMVPKASLGLMGSLGSLGSMGPLGAVGELGAQEADEEEWDVDGSLGPSRTLLFEVSEGTWMNVDVSPDGSTIAFDLLGDLYTMPIGGGRASRITSGAAFDIQPRFSPDGSRIAFISDRDGTNNVWLVDPDGSDPAQVSEESNRDVNSPAWSPDGEYLFVRKHFVDTRSLGAGEVWMYHRSGGSGLQVTERNGWQKDAGEPAISPDGGTLYYSKDVTPGQTFQYNKDPYGIIYAVLGRDLVTGEERTVSRRAGGSVTPRPSPDGTKLAFIRRVRMQTILFLRDLDTGEEWPLFDRLDRDNQEAWSIHGVYPQYDWTPDGSRIVIWGEGKIWSVDSESGEYEQIPFTAQVEQTVHEGVRFQQEVAPDNLQVRMLRDVVRSPDGQSVAYSALGRLYLKRLPDGAPRRVTADGRFEIEPAFSPDGQWLVYASWTDDEMGRIRVVRTDGTEGREIITTLGHYTEPEFSPDGAWVTYRSTGGDGVRGPTHGEHTGIYVVPVDGSEEPRRIRRDGSEPRFDNTGERLFVTTNRDGNTVLVSTTLEGTDEVVHFSSENATQIVPSPDGKWVAFTERFHAYIAAFPHSGRTITLGPDANGYPVTRVSRDAGDYLHWSSDSQSLNWSLGPRYFTRELTESFDFVAGAGDEVEEPEAEGIEIGFEVPTDRPTGTLAFTGARILTMNGDEVIENGTIVVERNRIVAVGPTGSVDVPAGAHTVDASGKTIMPGIVDVHAHVGGEGSGIPGEASWPLMANLAFGVTTSHDPSNNTEMVFTNSELIKTGQKLGPRLFSTGMILYGAETPFKAVVNSYEDALMHLGRMKAVGAFSVKSYNQRRRNARQWIIKAARELEMMVVPEGGSLVYNNLTMVLDGHTTVEHSLPVPVVYDDVAQLFGGSSTGYTPTMIVGYGGLSGEYFFYERDNVWENERLLTFTPRATVDARSRRRLKAAGDEDFNHVLISRGAKAIRDAGGSVQLGAHGQLQGLGAHWELWMFVQGGMSEMEALHVATIDGATSIGLGGDLGSIEEGKLADFLLLDANPLDDIRNTERVGHVVLNGRLYDAATLNEVGNHPRERPALYWERGRRSGM